MAKDIHTESFSNKVIDYKDTGIIISEPGIIGSKYIVYSRPGDEITFNFALNEDVRLEVIKGDIQIVFANMSTLTIVSLATLSFGANPPKIINLEGIRLSIEDLLNKAEVLAYDEAKLILTNKDTVAYTDEATDLVQVSSEYESNLEAGTPITGTGDTDQITSGNPSNIIIRDATSSINLDYTGAGSFVVTIYESESPYLYDKSNLDVGTITNVEDVKVVTTVWYGSSLISTGNISDYTYYEYSNGEMYITDKTAQVVPNDVNEASSSDNIYVNSHSASGNMDYVVELDYSGEIQPELIEITIPSNAVDAGVTLDGTNGTIIDSHYTDADGNEVYRLSLLDPSGKSYIKLSFPENTSTTFFDLNYQLTFFSPSTGKQEQSNISQNIVITPVTSEDDLLISSGDVLSSSPNPINVTTGSGDDIVIAAGSNNNITTNAGDDNIFTANGDDKVNAGEGDDSIWGSISNDSIDGGDGNDIVYYNNTNTGLDDKVNFSDSYYNTYNTTAGLFVYVGISAEEAEGVYFAEEDNVFTAGDTLVKNSLGVNTLTSIETIYLTDNVDQLTVGSDGLNSITVDGQAGIDYLYLTDSVVGAEIDLEYSTISDQDGEILSFSNFESITGSANDDYFYGYYNENPTNGFDYILDGGAGIDTLDYSKLEQGIVFNAAGSVDKGVFSSPDNSEYISIDYVENFEIIIGTSYDDVFYGGTEYSYEFYSGGGADSLDYTFASLGVTFDLATGKVYKSTNSDIYTKPDAEYDTFDDWQNGENIFLSNNDDLILGTDSGDYVIHANSGKDVLDYSNLNEGITVTINNGTGTVNKSDGTDKFNVFEEVNNNDQLNIYKIIGTDYDDTFIIDEGVIAEAHFFDGGAGTDTLDYSSFETDDSLSNQQGITISFEGGAEDSYVTKNFGTVDYFVNMEIIIGTDYNDTINFSSSLKQEDMDELYGMSINLGNGYDTVNFASVQLNSDEGIIIRYEYNSQAESADMIVCLADNPDSTITFLESEKVIGTNKNDTFYAIDGVDIGFDGQGGVDTANYSEVSTALEFHLVTATVNKGDNTDSIENVEVFYGGSSKNTYYASYDNSYTFYGVNNVVDTVSYKESAQGVTIDLENNLVYKGEDSSGNPRNIDTLIDIDIIEASNKNDTFIAYENDDTGTAISIALDGLEGNDTIDFSSYGESNALNIVIKNEGDAFIFDAGGITWSLTNIEYIIGTEYSDSFTIAGDININIDGGGQYDTVIYEEGYSYHVSIGSNTSVTKEGNGYHIDTFENIEEFTLSDQNDTVSMQENYQSNALESIDAGAGTDILSFQSVDVGLTITISGGDTISVDDGTEKQITFINFEHIVASEGETIFVLESDIAGMGDEPGLILEGNNVGNAYSEVQIKSSNSSTGVTVNLAQDSTGTDVITGGIDATISMRGIDKLTLTEADDIVYASQAKNMTFDGAGGDDTLDYSNFATGVGVTIDITDSTVTKNNNIAQYDSYENIEHINGTKNNDTLVISDLSNSSDIGIDLGKGNDTLFLNVDISLTYNIALGEITGGGDTININDFTNIEIIILSNQDDVIELEDGYSTTLEGLTVSAGGGIDTLDASNYDGEITFDAENNQITGGSETAVSINDVEIIQGSLENSNTFQGSQFSSYEYIGGNKADELTYEYSNFPISINIGESTIYAGLEEEEDNGEIVGVYDSYQNIETIIGTAGSDEVIIDSSITDVDLADLDNLVIELDVDGQQGASVDSLIFDLDEAVNVSIDVNGATSFTIGSDDNTIYKFQITGVDAFVLTNQDDTITIDIAYTEDITLNGAGGSDTVVYIGEGDIIFDATISTVFLYTAGSTNPTEELLLGIHTIDYQADGTAEMQAGAQGYIYKGKAESITLNYTNLSMAIKVDLENINGMGTVFKSNNADNDLFEINAVTEIIGTNYDDTFIIVENTSGHQIILDGNNGEDALSFESLTTEDNNFGNLDDGDGTSSLTDGYDIRSIEAWSLTNQNDTFYGYTDEEWQINGLDGVDTLDYSFEGYNITIDFTEGIVLKEDNSNGGVTSDTFTGFEGAVTGDGDDTFILGDEQIEGTFDAGGGTNSISFIGVEKNAIDLEFTSGDFDATFTDSDSGSSITSNYQGFTNIILSKQDDTVTYIYDANDEDYYSFDGYTGDDTMILTTASGGQNFYVNASGIDSFMVSTNDEFLKLTNFEVIQVGANDILNASSNALNTAITYIGGDTTEDSMDYSSSSTGIDLKVIIYTDDTLRLTAQSSVGDKDTLEGIETIILTDSSDTVSLVEYSGTNTLTVDAGAGTDVISLSGYGNAVNIEINEGGSFDFEGYSLENFEEYSLTNYDDTLWVVDATDFMINGGQGNDTLDLSGSGKSLTEGRILYYNDADSNVFTSNYQNIYTDFENIILTGYDDIINIQVYSNINYSIKIDMGAGNDSISFGDYADEEALVVTVNNGVASIYFSADTTVDASYIVSNWETIVGTNNDDTFTITGTITANQTYDGSLGYDTIDISGATTGTLDLTTSQFIINGTTDSIKFKSIEEFRVSDATIILSDLTNDGLFSTYIISGNNLIVDATAYSTGVEVTYNTFNIELVSGSSTNKISFQSIDLILTDYDDTLTIQSLADNSTIDMGDQDVVDVVDITELDGNANITLDSEGLDSEGNDSGVNIKIANANKETTIQNSEKLILSSTVTNTVNINLTKPATAYGTVQYTIVANGLNDTLNLNIATATNADQVIYSLANNSSNISSNLASGGSLILHVEGGFKTYNSSGNSDDIILLSQDLSGITFNAGGGEDTLDLSDFDAEGIQETYTITDYNTENGFTVETNTGSDKTATYTGINEIIFTSGADKVIVDDASFGSASEETLNAGSQSAGTKDVLEINNLGSSTIDLSYRVFAVHDENINYVNFESVAITGEAGANITINWNTNYYGSITTIILDENQNNIVNITNGYNASDEIISTQHTIDVEVGNESILISAGVADITFYNLDEINLGDDNDNVSYASDAQNNTIKIDAGAGADILVATTSDIVINNGIATVDNSEFSNFESFEAKNVILSESAFTANNDSDNIHIVAPDSVTINQNVSKEIVILSRGESFSAHLQYGTDYELNLRIETQNLIINNSDVYLEMRGADEQYSKLDSITVDSDSYFIINYSLYSPTNSVHAQLTADSTLHLEHAITTQDSNGQDVVIGYEDTLYDVSGVDEIYLSAGVDEIWIDNNTSLDASKYMYIDALGQQGAGGADILHVSGDNQVSGNTVTVNGGTIEFANFEVFDSKTKTRVIVNEESSVNYILSDEADTIIINEGVNGTLLLWAGDGTDYIIINGDYTVEEVYDDTLTIGGQVYDTGGSYLVVSDDEGNTIYIGDADSDDIVWGDKTDESNSEDVVNDNTGSSAVNSVSLDTNNDESSNIHNFEIKSEVVNEVIDYISSLNHDNHEIDFSNIMNYVKDSNLHQDEALENNANNDSPINLEAVVSKVLANNEDNLDTIISNLDGISNNLPSINLTNLDFSMNNTEESNTYDSLESKIDDSADQITDLQSILHKYNSNNGNTSI